VNTRCSGFLLGIIFSDLDLILVEFSQRNHGSPVKIFMQAFSDYFCVSDINKPPTTWIIQNIGTPNRSFFEQIQNSEGLDLPDNQGLVHDLGLVIIGVVLALLSNPDGGKLSSIHRHMKNNDTKLRGTFQKNDDKSPRK
jgi:hypothetical protein